MVESIGLPIQKRNLGFLIPFFYKNNFINTQGSFLFKIKHNADLDLKKELANKYIKDCRGGSRELNVRGQGLKKEKKIRDQ